MEKLAFFLEMTRESAKQCLAHVLVRLEVAQTAVDGELEDPSNDEHVAFQQQMVEYLGPLKEDRAKLQALLDALEPFKTNLRNEDKKEKEETATQEQEKEKEQEKEAGDKKRQRIEKEEGEEEDEN